MQRRWQGRRLAQLTIGTWWILAAVACGGGDGQTLYAQRHDGRLSIAGLVGDVPVDWERRPDEPRIWAKYSRAALAPDRVGAELVVHYDPADPGGAVEATLQHWVSQMSAPGGGDARRLELRSRWTIDDAIIDLVVVDGIYQRSLGGGPMTGGRTRAEPGYRLVGMVVEGPAGRAFLRLVGPRRTAEAMENELRGLLAAAKPESISAGDR